MTVDTDVPFAGLLTDEEIIAGFLPKQASDTSAEQEEEEVLQRISKIEASKHLQALKMYFMQSGEDRSESLKHLASIEKDLAVKTIQSNISSFFSI